VLAECFYNKVLSKLIVGVAVRKIFS